MSLSAICIEVRRKLQCANIYLTFEQALTECSSALKIILKSSEILITCNNFNSIIRLENFFSIEINSISSLVIQGKNVSFRVLLANDTGSLELLLSDDDDKETPKFVLKPTAVEHKLYQLTCENCENPLLCTETSFNRILELPSEFIGMCEWFCHKHDSVQHDLTPKINDMFFGLFFIVININNLCNITKREKYIYCKRCLKFLGESIYNENSIKLWNDSVHLNESGEKSLFFYTKSQKECICSIISKILDDCNVGPEMRFTQFTKIMFEATFPNRKKNFLMFNIMERNLEILTNFTVNSDNITLKEQRSLKILFKLEDDEENPLLNFWRTDFNVQNVCISYKIFSELAKCLIENSKLIPETYRSNNGFLLSYFCF